MTEDASEMASNRIAIGVDVREGEYLAHLMDALEELRSHGHRPEVLFLEAADATLVRRYHETGALVVSAGVDNKKVKDALEVIIKELGRLAKEPVGADELRRAKDFFLGQFELGLENSMSQMLWLGEDALTLGRCRTAEEVHKKTEAVSADDIRRVAGQLFVTPSLNLAVVGPSGTEKEYESILSFN